MNSANFQLKNNRSTRNQYYRRQIKLKFQNKRAEIIAWALFFGVGVSYFAASLILAVK